MSVAIAKSGPSFQSGSHSCPAVPRKRWRATSSGALEQIAGARTGDPPLLTVHLMTKAKVDHEIGRGE